MSTLKHIFIISFLFAFLPVSLPQAYRILFHTTSNRITIGAGKNMDVSFERAKNGKDEWLTPPHIIKSLGEFDIDPCSPVVRPWDTAKKHYTINDDGLNQTWSGRVWCNPPYETQAATWLKRCAEHGNCMALTFARTETRMFFDTVWYSAYAVLFLKGRLKFHHVDGKQGDSAGAPSILIAYDQKNAEVLSQSNIAGKYITLK